MKTTLFTLLTILSLAMFPSISEAKTVKVKSYYKPSTGTFVMPSHRTSPNKVKFDNYSSKGNFNPYSGKKGYKKF